MLRIWNYIVSLFFSLLILSSCSINIGKNDKIKNNPIQIFEYTYLGLDYPDAVGDPPKDMLKSFAKLGPSDRIQFLKSNETFTQLNYDTLGQLIKRTVFDLTSSKITQFSEDENGPYYKDLSQNNHFDHGLFKYENGAKLEKYFPEEYMIINDQKCHKYKYTTGPKADKIIIYINEDIPVEYFRGVANAPKGVPFFTSMEHYLILKVNFEVTSVENSSIKQDLTSLNTVGFSDFIERQNNLLSKLNLKTQLDSFRQQQYTNIYALNDTILVEYLRCEDIFNFNLKIGQKGLLFSYDELSQRPHAPENVPVKRVSDGPLYNLKKVNDDLSLAEYKYKYGTPTILIKHTINANAFIEIWQYPNRPMYKWNNFLDTCFSEEMFKDLVKEISPTLLGLNNPKIYMLKSREIEQTPWMMSFVRRCNRKK